MRRAPPETNVRGRNICPAAPLRLGVLCGLVAGLATATHADPRETDAGDYANKNPVHGTLQPSIPTYRNRDASRRRARRRAEARVSAAARRRRLQAALQKCRRRLPNCRWRTTMVGRLLVGVRERQHPRVAPEPAEERDAERIAPAADEAAGKGDLRQPGERALLTRARLAAEPLEAAFVRVRPREVGRVQQRVELLLIHQPDEEI